MTNLHKFIALGAAHWDILGRASIHMSLYDDVPGKVRRMIGGVAGPIALKLGALGADIDLMAYAGNDELGSALLTKLSEYNVGVKSMHRGAYPTDVYMGIEAPNGLIAAIADCHSLEAVSGGLVDALLARDLSNSSVIVDGNLHADALSFLSRQNFNCRELILVPASPGKIDRFLPFTGRDDARLYVNLREANALCHGKHQTAEEAALALIKLGYCAALVSNGANEAAHAGRHGLVTALPPKIDVKRFTGAGDTLTAHHLFARAKGDDPQTALFHALNATAQFISHEDLDV